MNKHPQKKRPQTREIKTPTYKPVKSDVRPNTAAGGGFVDKANAYRDLHAHALFSSLGRLVAEPFSSIMTIAVLAIAISLASGFYLVLVNAQQLTGNLEASTQISLFLKEEVSDNRAVKLLETIKNNPKVQQATLINREQGLEEFKTYSGFGSAVDALKSNPLPIVIEVLPKNSLTNKDDLEALQHEFQQNEGVELAQLDMLWLERLQSIIALGGQAVSLLNLMLGLAVLLITANTIRLELHSRREEVIIAKLMGATHAFIRRPFLYAGAWMGFISGVAAWFIVTVLMLALRSSVEHLSKLYGGDFHLLFFSFGQTLQLIAIATGLGVLGAWGVLIYQLQRTKPE
ncbi:MAG: permease-like cell division protein FtsX [Methylovulum sp.]|nr:permease-like cell division protein FtsX [Methylovulum sp.]